MWKVNVENIPEADDHENEEVKLFLIETFPGIKNMMYPEDMPLSKLLICKKYDVNPLAYDVIIAKYPEADEVVLLQEHISNSFYLWGFKDKIKNPKAIDMYVHREVPSNATMYIPKVHNDITEFQKQLQPFDINNPKRVDIENPRDDITIIDDESLKDLLDDVDDGGDDEL